MVVSIFGGSWADRHSRKLLIMLPDMVIAVVTVVLSLLARRWKVQRTSLATGADAAPLTGRDPAAVAPGPEDHRTP